MGSVPSGLAKKHLMEWKASRALFTGACNGPGMRGEGSVLTLGRRTRRAAQKTLTPSRFRQTIGYCNVDGAQFEPLSSGSLPLPLAPRSEAKSPLRSRVTCSEFHWPLTG